MNDINGTLQINKLTQNITLTVTFSSEFKLRLKIAKLLVRLATLVLGCRLEINE